MSSFFNSLADKAQTALNSSSIGQQIQSKLGGVTGEHQAGAGEGSAQGGPGGRNSTLGNLTHQFRSLQMQYSTVSPIQRVITSEKGVILDFASVAKDAKAQSKELYTWGQSEHEDLKDVTDRLAYLNFVHGSLSSNLAQRLDSARSSLKILRDAENNIAPRRQQRNVIQMQINRIEHEKPKGLENRLADLKGQLKKLESDDDTSEREIEIMKRKAVKDSEAWKWAALREYGEKLILLAQASESIVDALPSDPPTATQPYRGAQTTAATRASLQFALDHYKPGSISHAFQPSDADLGRSDSRSFGVTHATELSNIATHGSRPGSRPGTPPMNIRRDSHDSAGHLAVSPGSPVLPVNPASLNNEPAKIPSSPKRSSISSAGVGTLNLQPEASHDAQEPAPSMEGPTVAETGVPLSAGADGPGPSSGSLLDLKARHSPSPSPRLPPSSFPVPGRESSSSSASMPTISPIPSLPPPSTDSPTATAYNPPSGPPPASLPGYSTGVTAEKPEIVGVVPTVSAPVPVKKYESAEEEKARLQREDRERILQGEASATPPQKYETAEEEKKRLEREERDRLLSEGSSGNPNPSRKDTTDDEGQPPAYQDF
ncbi:hypothetical protein SCHPADRAFT_992308 [Schizopora paradoxa]|uniref:Sphingolipid long chain base-responsive protein LSP1 n=1 Tax=Schizopora paradoxa TaxID=27342 RepID=A0A0H2S7J6_9AGAM|nr:hypothetical protein SCHPADRAFT_992308 [Schizopora paradoxa]